jgi:hypothetical protein
MYQTYLKTLIAVVLLLFSTGSVAGESYTTTFENLVDDAGNITLPTNFRSDWTFLGTWSIAAEDVETSSEASGHGAAGLHNVYTQSGVAEYFQQNGKFPDGAVIVKELLKATTAPMTTGTVSRGSEVEGWFVMVKDTEGRFESNPLWGDGWGWALFNADKPEKTVTQNYKTECLGCHIPARNDDWIYLSGYPILSH